MSAAQLVEKTRDLLLAEIKAKISPALTKIRDDRADRKVSTEPTIKYFIFDPAITYECPAIFLIVDRMRPMNEQFKTNHVNAQVTLNCSVVVEEIEGQDLVIKCERYQAALFEILHEKTLSDEAKNVKIYSEVTDVLFSPLFVKDQKTPTMARFRKEAALKLQVMHYESLSTV